jgi:hypothetical protein
MFNDNDKSENIDVVDQDDYSTKLKVVSLVNYLSQELALRKQSTRPVIICQTLCHEVCTSLLNFGVDRIISLTNMKYTLLAYASLFPGFLSVFINLTVPSTIYNKKGTTSDPKKWKNEFEWGHSFELVEIPVQPNTSADIKRLSFSQVPSSSRLPPFSPSLLSPFSLSLTPLLSFTLDRHVASFMSVQMEQQSVWQCLVTHSSQGSFSIQKEEFRLETVPRSL